MKSSPVHLILFLATAFLAHAQSPYLHLNPGDVWTNSFNTLPFTGTTFPFGAGTSYGNLQMNFTHFRNGAMRYEIFEGVDAGGNAARSGLITSGVNFSTTQSFLWQDLNGSVRLTMLTGECIVGSITYQVGKPSPENPVNRVDTYTAAASSLKSPWPRLMVTRLSNVLELSWWTNTPCCNFVETTNVLNSGEWPSAQREPDIVSNRYTILVEPLNRSYFRLRHWEH